MGVSIKPIKLEKFLEKNYWILKRSGRNEMKGSFLNTIKLDNGNTSVKNATIMFGVHRSDIAFDAIKRIKKQFELITERKYSIDEFVLLIKKNKRIINL